jgi:hypothetical protein
MSQATTSCSRHSSSAVHPADAMQKTRPGDENATDAETAGVVRAVFDERVRQPVILMSNDVIEQDRIVDLCRKRTDIVNAYGFVDRDNGVFVGLEIPAQRRVERLVRLRRHGMAY